MYTKNDGRLMHGSWENFLSFKTIFLSFFPLATPEIKILKKMKKMPTNIISHMYTINDKHMMYGSWVMERKGENFVILGNFLPFYPTNNSENQNFEKIKKRLEYYKT